MIDNVKKYEAQLREDQDEAARERENLIMKNLELEKEIIRTQEAAKVEKANAEKLAAQRKAYVAETNSKKWFWEKKLDY